MSLYLDHVPQYSELINKQSRILALGLKGAELPLRPLLCCIQAWRPSYLNLLSQNIETYASSQAINSRKFESGLLALSKHKAFDKNSFLYLLKKVQAEGTIIITGPKELGAESMHRWVKQHFTIIAKYAKRHHISFIIKNSPIPPFKAEQFYSSALTVATDYKTQPGMFSHGKVDIGSQILSDVIKQHSTLIFSKTISNIADFGAGWGYLALTTAKLTNNIKNIALYEADYNALAAAEETIKTQKLNIGFNFQWLDLVQEEVNENYDLIISNPPFHEGRHADATLGQAFIQKAAKHIKPKGKLLIVANQHLPYEKILQQNYTSFTCLAIRRGFKILYATK